MAGASGRLGGHLNARLTSDGHTITRLVRHRTTRPNEIEWNPYTRTLDPAILEEIDMVINLGGVGVADKRWTLAYKQLIKDSRVIPTRVLAEAVAQAKVPNFINASAVGWYGDCGSRPVDESDRHAKDFLGRTCKAWEDATDPAAKAGARVVRLRTGHVMAPDALMLQRLLPLFRFGLGGKFGSGQQYLPWISLSDWLGAVQHICDHKVEGPANLVGPTPATNAQFTAALAKVMHRPALFAIPGPAIKLAVGEAASELLRGARVEPAVLKDNGYKFRHSTIDEALSWAVYSR